MLHRILCRVCEIEIAVKSQMLDDYLRWIFPPENEDGPCRESITRPIGILRVTWALPAVMRSSTTGDNVVKLDPDAAPKIFFRNYVKSYTGEKSGTMLAETKWALASSPCDFQDSWLVT